MSDKKVLKKFCGTLRGTYSQGVYKTHFERSKVNRKKTHPPSFWILFNHISEGSKMKKIKHFPGNPKKIMTFL